jgi:hypothetical protein
LPAFKFDTTGLSLRDVCGTAWHVLRPNAVDWTISRGAPRFERLFSDAADLVYGKAELKREG